MSIIPPPDGLCILLTPCTAVGGSQLPADENQGSQFMRDSALKVGFYVEQARGGGWSRRTAVGRPTDAWEV